MKKLLITILVVFSILVIGFVGGVKTRDYYKDTRILPIAGAVWQVGDFGSGLRDFESLEELEEWLAFDDTSEHLILYAGEDGKVNFDGICEVYAIQLQERALTDGYKMSFYYVDRQEMWLRFKVRMNPYQAHAMNLVIIGNNIYIIEPSDDKVTLIAYLE